MFLLWEIYMSDFIKVRNSAVFKLKDKLDRNYVKIDLIKIFGFLPDKIIIEKIKRMNNTLIVRAIVPEGIESEVQDDKPSN